ncbi:MAG TPA: hypothetical protein VJR92_05570 [Gemmatimonadaceae bacterium]|nr:hypothetical protein [Gemmatimonadaceae bacterium]
MSFRRIALAMCACAAALSAGPLACGPREPRRLETKAFTQDFAMRISWDPTPPYAREPIIVRLVVRDKKTGEPIENGEGRAFANNAGGQDTWDVFVPSPESGTYTAKLSFLTAGEWALGIQFRRDSTSRLQRPEDIRLSVRGER